MGKDSKKEKVGDYEPSRKAAMETDEELEASEEETLNKRINEAHDAERDLFEDEDY